MKSVTIKHSIALLVIYFLLYLYIKDYCGFYVKELYLLLYSFIPFSLIYLLGVSCKAYRIFYPYPMISILYFLLFILSPMTFILTNETDCHGDYVMGGCEYGTFLTLLSYFFLTIGYIKKKNIGLLGIGEEQYHLSGSATNIALLFWVIGAVSCIIYINKSGVSIMYLLFYTSDTMNLDTTANTENVKFLSNFAYFMVFPLTLLSCFSKKKWLITVLIIFTFLLFYIRGTRIFIVIQLLSIVLLYVRVKNKKIKKVYVVCGVVLLLGIFSFMGTNRKNVKQGAAVEYELTATDFINMLSTNFDIYKPYYGLVANCPEKFEHTMGRGMILEPIKSLIPRAIWKNKDTGTCMSEAVLNTTGEGPSRAAMSWPHIAEYYMDFGVWGIVILSYLFGFLLSTSINLYNSQRVENIILYSLLFPTFFQLVIRGYTPINFIMYVCLLFPYIFMNKCNLLTKK